jgi:hypothetical protein
VVAGAEALTHIWRFLILNEQSKTKAHPYGIDNFSARRVSLFKCSFLCGYKIKSNFSHLLGVSKFI